MGYASFPSRYNLYDEGATNQLGRERGENNMHTCEPPGQALEDWLESYPSTTDNYGHLLLEQKGTSDQALVESLVPYFESAHLDAREQFHQQIGIDLHPDADAPGAHAQHPGCRSMPICW